ncbi:SDR family oxidoreductase [bacterium]|nr:SDR family oxidoreductase [bacterium]
MKDKTVLVTGGAGFIGSHIVDACVARGAKVKVLDDLSSGKEKNLSSVWSSIEFIQGDIRDREMVKKAMENVDYVSHQAALRSVPRSMEMPEEYNDVNVNGTLNLLVAAKENKIKKFVLASSSSVYGNVEKLPQSESDPCRPISPYAMTKLIGEKYLQLFNDVYNFSTTSLRYFNVFGPRQGLDNDYAVVIPKFITCIMSDEKPPIFGDGNQTRDFTYVENIVNANILAMTSACGNGEAYNAAAGDSKSVLDIVNTLNNIFGKKIAPEFLPIRKGDVLHTKADPSKIIQDMKWNCEISFSEGLRKTVEAFQQ